MLPVMRHSRSLYEAGWIGLFEQLLGVGHQSRMLQQPLPFKDLPGQGLLPPVAGSLQGQGQTPLTLSYSLFQLSDTVSEVPQSH